MLLAGAALIGAGVTVAATAINWSASSAAKLVFAGGAPQAPLFRVKIENGKHFFYVTSRPLFKNKGSVGAAIQKVNIEPMGLKQPPQNLEVLRLDKTTIEPNQTKEIRCEFVAVIDSAALNPPTPLESRVHFYGADGHEVYWEGITIENIEPHSSPPRHGSRKGGILEPLASRLVET
jgi:hypothetical protein